MNVGNHTLDVLHVRARTLWGTVDTYKGIGAKVRRALNWPRKIMSGVPFTSSQASRPTGIGLCPPVVSTRGPFWLLPSGVSTLKHLFEEAELRGDKLTEQENREDNREIFGHASYNTEVRLEFDRHA